MSFVDTYRPVRWRAATTFVVVLTAAYLGSCLLALFALAWDYSLVDGLNDPGRPNTATLESVRSLEQALATAVRFLIYAYIVAYIVWLRTARRAAQPFGVAGATALRHWALMAWRLGILVSLAITFLAVSDTPAFYSTRADVIAATLRQDRDQMLYYGVRVAVAALLITGVLVVAGRLRALTERAAPAYPF
jgi:hypothetical protein